MTKVSKRYLGFSRAVGSSGPEVEPPDGDGGAAGRPGAWRGADCSYCWDSYDCCSY